MRCFTKSNNGGFTLIEMVAVIVLLGVVSLGVTSFLKIGTQAYVDVTARDELIASGRFAVERLNRELRSALPNSIRVTNSEQCIEFYSTVASAIYTDAPVAPETQRKTIDIIRFNKNASFIPSDYYVAIYPLFASDLYPIDTSGHVAAIDNLSESGNKWQITLKNSTLFAQDSPTKRVYFIQPTPIKYCIENLGIDMVLTRNDVLMAENIVTGDSSFLVDNATHQRNAVITVLLTFDNKGERMTFNNKVQVINVP